MLLWFAFKFYLCLSSFNKWNYLSTNNMLWFAFKFYLWQRSYKLCRWKNWRPLVVICFQILSLTTFLQVCCRTPSKRLCCDLLSNFIFDNVLTSLQSEQFTRLQLWFAFKFYLWQRSYKTPIMYNYHLLVVICFQILSLTTFLQAQCMKLLWCMSCDLLSNFIFDNVLTRLSYSARGRLRCDLLSNFIFDNVLTRNREPSCDWNWLWFAFKFYLWQRSYKPPLVFLTLLIVVICFQILSLTTFLQEIVWSIWINQGCDLLSNFIFDNVLTSNQGRNIFQFLLWFAFKFYLWQRSYNTAIYLITRNAVVICFQILSLTTFLQSKVRVQDSLMCCDLLSNFIFDNVLTINEPNDLKTYMLWFAFKFYLWQRSYNTTANYWKTPRLWFAFKFYLWQRSYNRKLIN